MTHPENEQPERSDLLDVKADADNVEEALAFMAELDPEQRAVFLDVFSHESQEAISQEGRGFTVTKWGIMPGEKTAMEKSLYSAIEADRLSRSAELVDNPGTKADYDQQAANMREQAEYWRSVADVADNPEAEDGL